MADGMRVGGGMYQPPTEISPQQPCSVTLHAQQWQDILRVLHQAPYGMAAPLIESIVRQCLRPQPEMPGRQNGEAPQLPVPGGP